MAVDPKAELKMLLMRPENRRCCDCGARDPKWASMNLGVFFCIDCSGIHRAIGTHITKVKSTTLDSWKIEWVRHMETWGNLRGNAVWEARLRDPSIKPQEDATMAQRDKFIRKKYDEAAWKGQPSADALAAIAAANAPAAPKEKRLNPAVLRRLQKQNGGADLAERSGTPDSVASAPAGPAAHSNTASSSSGFSFLGGAAPSSKAATRAVSIGPDRGTNAVRSGQSGSKQSRQPTTATASKTAPVSAAPTTPASPSSGFSFLAATTSTAATAMAGVPAATMGASIPVAVAETDSPKPAPTAESDEDLLGIGSHTQSASTGSGFADLEELFGSASVSASSPAAVGSAPASTGAPQSTAPVEKAGETREERKRRLMEAVSQASLQSPQPHRGVATAPHAMHMGISEAFHPHVHGGAMMHGGGMHMGMGFHAHGHGQQHTQQHAQAGFMGHMHPQPGVVGQHVHGSMGGQMPTGQFFQHHGHHHHQFR